MAPKLFVLRTAKERRKALIIKALEKRLPEAGEKEFERVLRFSKDEEARRKAYLKEHGLPARLRMEKMDGCLWALVITPLPGWVHLVRGPCVREAVKRFGAYHVSICYDSDVKADAAHHLEAALRRWGEWQGVLTAEWVSPKAGKGYFELSAAGPFRTCPHLTALHRSGSYADRELHISM